MRSFVELLTTDMDCSVAEQQAFAARQLPILLDESRLNLWTPQDCIILKTGKRLLLGIASYSINDLKLLDTLNQAFVNKTLRIECVDVFNVINGYTMEDFEKYFPGIGKVYQTPIAGMWEDGLLKDISWGKSAVVLINSILLD